MATEPQPLQETLSRTLVRGLVNNLSPDEQECLRINLVDVDPELEGRSLREAVNDFFWGATGAGRNTPIDQRKACLEGFVAAGQQKRPYYEEMHRFREELLRLDFRALISRVPMLRDLARLEDTDRLHRAREMLTDPRSFLPARSFQYDAGVIRCALGESVENGLTMEAFRAKMAHEVGHWFDMQTRTNYQPGNITNRIISFHTRRTTPRHQTEYAADGYSSLILRYLMRMDRDAVRRGVQKAHPGEGDVGTNEHPPDARRREWILRTYERSASPFPVTLTVR